MSGWQWPFSFSRLHAMQHVRYIPPTILEEEKSPPPPYKRIELILWPYLTQGV